MMKHKQASKLEQELNIGTELCAEVNVCLGKYKVGVKICWHC